MQRKPITQRLALWSARRPRLTIAIWAVVLVAAVVLVGQFIGALEASDDFVGRPESKQAEELIANRLPGADADIEIVVVRSARQTVDDPAFRSFVRDLTRRISALGAGDVAEVRSYLDADPAQASALVSRDRRTTILPVRLPDPLVGARPHLDRLVPVVERAARQEGFTVLLTGNAAWERDATELAATDLARGELIGLPIALLILLVVFGALVAAGLPLLLAVLAIVVALALTAVVGQAFTTSVFAVNVITMMGLAVGIDYSLFIVSRFREEMAKDGDAVGAVGRTAATASRAVLFSGLTVVLALAGMLLVPFSIFTSMGVGAILVVIAAVAAALTLLPASLALLGERVDALRLPRWLRPGGSGQGRSRFWQSTAHLVMTHRVRALLVGGGILVLLAVPALLMQRGETGVAGTPERLGTHRAYEILSREFSAGLTSPLLVAIDGRLTDPRVAQGVERLQKAVAADGRFTVTGWQAAPGNDFALLQLATRSEATSAPAIDAVDDLRRRLIPQALGDAPARALVGGGPATFADMNVIVDRFTPIVLVAVLSLSFVLLLLAFRSLVIALKAVIMNLLSVGAAYGLLVLVFQKGVGAGLLGLQQIDRIESFVPLLLFCVLFGLSMDYQVFLLSRIRERYDLCGDTREAVAFGLSSTAGIITGAALIMVAVFAGLASGELVMFQQIGFGLAVAIALDATLVRTVVVPATMALLGDWNWYLPRWLEWLPRVSVDEGSRADEAPTEGKPAGWAPPDERSGEARRPLRRPSGGASARRAQPEPPRASTR